MDHQWNVPLLCSLFSKLKWRPFLHSPQCSYWPDKLIWHFHSKGLFSVKNAYYIALEWVYRSPTAAFGSSNGFSLSKLWRCIWATQVHPKVKVGAWRICKNIIPTQVNLVRRHIYYYTSCLLCNSGTESSLHLMFDCPFTTCTWMVIPLGLPQSGLQIQSMSDWGLYLTSNLSYPNFDLVLMIWWAIWGARNNLIWNGSTERPDLVAAQAMLFWNCFISSSFPPPSFYCCLASCELDQTSFLAL